MKKLTLTLVFLTLLLTACTGTATPTAAPAAAAQAEIQPGVVTAEGKLLPAPAVELAFAQGGVVAEVLVQPGDQVTAGEVLARLVGLETVQAELAAAKLEQTVAQQALDQLKRNALLTAAQTEKALLEAQKAYESESAGWNLGNRNEASALELTLDDYVTAEQDDRAARQKLEALLNKEKTNRERQDAQDDYDREKQSLSDNYAEVLKEVSASDQSLTEAQTRLLSAISSLEVARQNQARLDDQNLDPEKLAAAQAKLEAATAHLTAAQAALELYELRAPFGGQLLSFDLKAGEAVSPGLPLAFLADTTTWTVETKDLAEIDIARVALGQSAAVKLDAFPGEEFPATVAAIDPVGQEYLGDMTYQVTVTLDQPDPRFLWNMTATVNVAVR
jgi:multidrug resistance efflux pump